MAIKVKNCQGDLIKFDMEILVILPLHINAKVPWQIKE